MDANNDSPAPAPAAAAAAPSIPTNQSNANPVTANQANPNAKVVEEFEYLLEKSQQLFSGLRDLPPTGRNWQPYFQRTFEVYTKLWKFQQQNRHILENKDMYGLKRWEIGEIASKIGQLYYHYYLRTSETNYLYESFVFYEAIRERQYFKDVMEAKNPALVIKKLRYYARFIVVCLLLNRNDMIKKLMDELTSLVDDYTKTFKPMDSAEWNVVLSEIGMFLEAEKKLTPLGTDGNILPIVNRLGVEKTPKLDKDGQPKLRLQEAILVGNYQNQIKFSELTLDMYRVLQSLERVPTVQTGKNNSIEAPTEKKEDAQDAQTDNGMDKSSRRSNPHKYLLYRPTFAQLMLYISTAFKDINEHSALMLYLSADGTKRQSKSDQPDAGYQGGVATAVTYSRKSQEKAEADQMSILHCLHPHDLLPFTRKPMFVIIDSNNSTAFKNFPKVFNQSLVCLLSPTEYPSTIKDTTQIGSLFTLFLHSPLKAFAFVCQITEISSEQWGKCLSIINNLEKSALDLLEGPVSANLDKSFKRFLQDDFLRQLIARFVVTSAILEAHSSFKEPKFLPSSYPSLPAGFCSANELVSQIQELASTTNVASLFTSQ